MVTYKDSGVNIELGDDVSKILYNASKLTWDNRKGRLGEIIVPFDDFTGIRAINVSNLPYGTLMNIGFDGVGTKIDLAERIQKHDTVAHDLFAMVCDDAVVRGAEPIIIGSILDVKNLSEDGKPYTNFVKQLAKGYINAAKEANVAVVNGEVAELGARVGGYTVLPGIKKRLIQSFKYLLKGEYPKNSGFNYNWGAGVVWFAKKDRMFTGYEIKKGDKLVALKEEKFRSNGLSLVRKIMENTHGMEWHNYTLDNEKLGELILHPSKIYSKAVVEMFGGFENEPQAKIHGVAHITGGGIPGKLGRVLKPSGFGADISDAFNPCKMMHYCQEKGNVKDNESYKTFNMGQGMIVITPEPDKAINIAKKYNITSKIIGEISERQGIRIKSKGIYDYGKELEFV